MWNSKPPEQYWCLSVPNIEIVVKEGQLKANVEYYQNCICRGGDFCAWEKEQERQVPAFFHTPSASLQMMLQVVCLSLSGMRSF